MAAPAEVVEGLLCRMRVLDGDGFDYDADAAKECIALPEHIGSKLTFDDDREFEEIPGGDTATRCAADGADEEFGIRLFRNDGDEVRRYQGSFRKAAFVVEVLRVIEVRTLDVGGGAVGDRTDVSGERFGGVFAKTLVALTQRLCHSARQGFAGFLSDCLSKPMGFRIFNVETISHFLYHQSTDFTLSARTN